MLMRFIKARGGLLGGRLRNQSSGHITWIAGLEHFAGISQAVQTKVLCTGKKANDHPDTKPAAVKKNLTAFLRTKTWIEETLDLDQQPNILMSFSTGLYSEDNDQAGKTVNPEMADSVGAAMQIKMDGENFCTTMETNLSTLRKTIKISGSPKVIDSLALFNRLVMISDRQGEVCDAFAFESTPMPLSLFDQGQNMRKAQKSVLGKHLKSFDATGPIVQQNPSIVIDGGWLLHQCCYQSGETFGKISLKYASVVSNLAKGRHCTVVFDGYSSSPKDHEHLRRLKNHSANVSLTPSTPCTMSKSRFLANSHNKSQLISLLKTVLGSQGVEVVVAEDDADTLVVREAMKAALTQAVDVKADDTDILCMLVTHIHAVSKDIIVHTKGGAFNVKHIRDNMPNNELRMLLLSHAFSGCDTTSGILGHGKVRVLKKMAAQTAPKDALETLLDLRSNRESIGRAGIVLFQYLYGRPSTPLSQIRYDLYSKLVAKGKFLPQKLPPTDASATQHTLRAYLQYRDWAMLESQSLNPSLYGWVKSSQTFEPVGFEGEIAPAALLNFTACNCKTDNPDSACNSNRCSCRRMGLSCLAACGNCHGVNCQNSGSTNRNEEEPEHAPEGEYLDDDAQDCDD